MKNWVLAQFAGLRHVELGSTSDFVVFRPRNKFGVTTRIENEPLPKIGF